LQRVLSLLAAAIKVDKPVAAVRTAIDFTQCHLSKPVGCGWLATVRACEDGGMPITKIQSDKKKNEYDHESPGLSIDSSRYKWQRSE
jgi:hypothetical protein